MYGQDGMPHFNNAGKSKRNAEKCENQAESGLFQNWEQQQAAVCEVKPKAAETKGSESERSRVCVLGLLLLQPVKTSMTLERKIVVDRWLFTRVSALLRN